jgi:hypothetical protein
LKDGTIGSRQGEGGQVGYNVYACHEELRSFGFGFDSACRCSGHYGRDSCFYPFHPIRLTIAAIHELVHRRLVLYDLFPSCPLSYGSIDQGCDCGRVPLTNNHDHGYIYGRHIVHPNAVTDHEGLMISSSENTARKKGKVDDLYVKHIDRQG